MYMSKDFDGTLEPNESNSYSSLMNTKSWFEQAIVGLYETFITLISFQLPGHQSIFF